MPSIDVAVAGCGPGGLATALLLHRAEHRVRLFERFGEPRPIGSGLMIQPTCHDPLTKWVSDSCQSPSPAGNENETRIDARPTGR